MYHRHTQTFQKNCFFSLRQDSAVLPEHIWNEIGSPCYFKDETNSYSYFSTYVDVGFGVTPFNKIVSVDQKKILNLLRAMHKNGCDINARHPVTGHTPAHTLAIFYRKNTQLAKMLASFGVNLEIKTPKTDKYYPNMSSLEIMNEIIVKYHPQTEREEFLKYVSSKSS